MTKKQLFFFFAFDLLIMGLLLGYFFYPEELKLTPEKTVVVKETSVINKPEESIQLIQQRENKRNNLTNELSELETCQENDRCNFADTDPKAVYFAVSDAIKTKLRHFKEQADSEAIRLMGLRFITFDNDEVRLAALDLIASQPPKADNIPNLIKGIKWSTDPSVFKAGIMEFSRYPQQNAEITQFLLETIQSGAIFVKREVAKQILPLLNPDNIQQFEQLLLTLPAKNTTTQNLKNTLLEYQESNSH